MLSFYDIQSSAYTWLLQRQEKFTVTFQDIDKSNALIKKAGIAYQDITLNDKGELCKLLGVDAIISGKATMLVTMNRLRAGYLFMPAYLEKVF